MTDKKRILVVDDEPDITLMVRLNLQKTGRFEVCEENNPGNAVHAAREFKPDVILLDVMMPDLDGGEVLFELQRDPDLKNVPVIFVTATVLQEQVQSAGGKIGHRFMPKPFKISALLTMIDDVLKPAAS
jgi:two-component system, OmpR family, response regulator